jgi:hypothetical protein
MLNKTSIARSRIIKAASRIESLAVNRQYRPIVLVTRGAETGRGKADIVAFTARNESLWWDAAMRGIGENWRNPCWARLLLDWIAGLDRSRTRP